MPRIPRRTAHRGAARKHDAPLFAVAEHRCWDGAKETLRLSAGEVTVIRTQRGSTSKEAIPLRDLERIRTTSRVMPLHLIVALSYLLGASIFLYLLVRLIHLLSEGSLFMALGALVGMAAVAGVAAWTGQEAVLQFIGKERHRRVEYHLAAGERDRLGALAPLAGMQEK